MKITGLPDPPFPCDEVEWRSYADAGEAWLEDKHWRIASAKTMLICNCHVAIPKPLIGTDWLDAQKPGTVFEYGGERYMVGWAIGDRRCLSMERVRHYAYKNLRGWHDLDVCFPDGWRGLSDTTCKILLKGE